MSYCSRWESMPLALISFKRDIIIIIKKSLVSDDNKDPVTNKPFEFIIPHLGKFDNNMDVQYSYFCHLAKYSEDLLWYFSFHCIPLMIESK